MLNSPAHSYTETRNSLSLREWEQETKAHQHYLPQGGHIPLPLPLAGPGGRVMLLEKTPSWSALQLELTLFSTLCMKNHHYWLYLRITILLKVLSPSSPDPLGSCLEPRSLVVRYG